jgi:hypothetical protein
MTGGRLHSRQVDDVTGCDVIVYAHVNAASLHLEHALILKDALGHLRGHVLALGVDQFHQARARSQRAAGDVLSRTPCDKCLYLRSLHHSAEMPLAQSDAFCGCFLCFAFAGREEVYCLTERLGNSRFFDALARCWCNALIGWCKVEHVGSVSGAGGARQRTGLVEVLGMWMAPASAVGLAV